MERGVDRAREVLDVGVPELRVVAIRRVRIGPEVPANVLDGPRPAIPDRPVRAPGQGAEPRHVVRERDGDPVGRVGYVLVRGLRDGAAVTHPHSDGRADGGEVGLQLGDGRDRIRQEG